MTEPSKVTIIWITIILIIFSLFGQCTCAGATEQEDVIKAQEFHIQTLRGRLSQGGIFQKQLVSSFAKAVQEADNNTNRLYRICLSVFFCMSALCVILTTMGYFMGTCKGRRRKE